MKKTYGLGEFKKEEECYNKNRCCTGYNCPCDKQITKESHKRHMIEVYNNNPKITPEGIAKGLMYFKKNNMLLFFEGAKNYFQETDPELLEQARRCLK